MAAAASGRALVGSIDQGTTSTRFIVFDQDGKIVCMDQEEHEQFHPGDGMVEHDADEIWDKTCKVIRGALDKGGLKPSDLKAVGITNQRETVVAWDKTTSKPLRRAIVWQDTRGASFCKHLARKLGGVDALRSQTGLPLDPYFAGSKMRWMVAHDSSVKAALDDGRLALGTVDSWLVWKLTGGGSFVTDVTNASRTLLMDLESLQWDGALCRHFGLPEDADVLPSIKTCSEEYGVGSSSGPLPGVPIAGILGDQQAALFGQACFHSGQLKCTFGTGCFVLQNTGTEALRSEHKLLTTVAYQLRDRATGEAQRPVFALEGSVAQAGSVVQWLRDKVGLIKTAPETEALAGSVDSSGGVVLVPAFTGLFAPHWDSTARGVMVGMTGSTGAAEIARAALDSVSLQATELVTCLRGDLEGRGSESSTGAEDEVRVDGGMVANGLFLQMLADASGRTIVRPQVIETTALGAAYAAGLAVGVWGDVSEVERQWARESEVHPRSTEADRVAIMDRWSRAVSRAKGWVESEGSESDDADDKDDDEDEDAHGGDGKGPAGGDAKGEECGWCAGGGGTLAVGLLAAAAGLLVGWSLARRQ